MVSFQCGGVPRNDPSNAPLFHNAASGAAFPAYHRQVPVEPLCGSRPSPRGVGLDQVLRELLHLVARTLQGRRQRLVLAVLLLGPKQRSRRGRGPQVRRAGRKRGAERQSSPTADDSPAEPQAPCASAGWRASVYRLPAEPNRGVRPRTRSASTMRFSKAMSMAVRVPSKLAPCRPSSSTCIGPA